MGKDLVGNSHPTVTLKEVVTRLTNGYVGPTRDIYVENGIPYLLARHVKDNQLIFDQQTFVSHKFNQKHHKSILKTDDVLMVQSGHIGETAVVPEVHAGQNCHAMIVITPSHEKLSSHYLSYYFHSEIGRDKLRKLKTGITLEHLNCRDVREVKIPLPPLEEQRRIADIATKADRLRRTRRYAQQLSDTYLQSVFLEMFGDPVSNPKGWKQGYFSELIASTQNGLGQRKDFDSQGTIVLRIKDVRTGFIDYSDLRRMAVPEADIQKYQLNNDDLILVRVNGNPKGVTLLE